LPPDAAEAKLQARIFTKDLTDEQIDALAAVAVAGEQDAQCQQVKMGSCCSWYSMAGTTSSLK